MNLTHEALSVHTKRPFKIAVGTETEIRVVIARLEHDGIVGLGEAAPSKRVTGEDVKSVGTFLDWAATEVADVKPAQWAEFLDHIHQDICGNPAARAALDLALHDLVGKLQGVPARAMYGLPGARLETSMTVSMDEPAVMAEEARGYRDAGFRCLKLKLGDITMDAARVAAVRAACPDARLRADANTAWGAEAWRLTSELAKLGVEFVEQPTVPEDHEGLAEFARKSAIPVYADESVHDALDVERLHKAGFRGGVNLKIQKAGGLRPTIQAARAAKALGYQVQLGCMVETSIGISAGVQMLSLLDHADLDGALLLRDDPFEGARVRDGWMETGDGPGLGLTAPPG